MCQQTARREISYFKKGIKGIQRYIGLQILYISVCMHVISALLGLIIINEYHTHVLASSRLYLSSASRSAAAGEAAHVAVQGVWRRNL